jgi:hypothetical protein
MGIRRSLLVMNRPRRGVISPADDGVGAERTLSPEIVRARPITVNPAVRPDAIPLGYWQTLGTEKARSRGEPWRFTRQADGVRPISFPGAKSEVTPPSLDALIAAIAARQHGVITTAQLLRAGLGHSAISKRAASGRLHRRYPGVYALGQPRLSQEGQWMAAILACGPGCCLAFLSAAVHMRLWRRRATGIDVLVPTRHRGPSGVRVHRCRHLEAQDVTRRADIPVTTASRTLVDLSDVLTPHQLANVIHEAAFRKLFDERAVRAAMTRANGRHNLHVLAKALELHAAGSAGTRSELEDRFLTLTSNAGLPEPRVNTAVEEIEVDFHWPQLNLIVEVDGPGHTRPRTKREDAQRDACLRAAGHTVHRIRDHEIDGY